LICSSLSSSSVGVGVGLWGGRGGLKNENNQKQQRTGKY
jgi:hypothetical protein